MQVQKLLRIKIEQKFIKRKKNPSEMGSKYIILTLAFITQVNKISAQGLCYYDYESQENVSEMKFNHFIFSIR